MITQNSVMNLLIGKKLSRTASAQVTNSSAASYIADGEIVVTDASGTVLDTTTVLNQPSIFIVQGQGTTKPVIWSDEIFKTSVTQFEGQAYDAPTVQIDYIGYDAVNNTGAIEVLNDNDYTVELKDIDSTTFGTLAYSKFGFYTSDSSATEREIALGLTESLFTNTRDLYFPAVLIEMVNDGTFAAASVVTYTFVNGSPNVTSSAGTTVVAGDLIRVATNTDVIAVYEVAAKGTGAFPGAGANDFRLNYPYQGASGTTTAVYRQTAAPATGYGIRVTGRAPYWVAPNVTTYHVNRFKTILKRAGSTPVTTTQDATEGSGAYEQIANLEYFLIGNEGLSAREGVIPQITVRANAESTAQYGIITLAHSRKEGGQITENPRAFKQLMIAFNGVGGHGTSASGAVTSVEDVLEAWLSTFPAISI